MEAAWLEEAVRDAVQMVETGSYQGLVERELPIWHRTGTILRRDLWRVFPQWKEEFFQDFSQQEMEDEDLVTRVKQTYHYQADRVRKALSQLPEKGSSMKM